jgi:hypothetical protein
MYTMLDLKCSTFVFCNAFTLDINVTIVDCIINTITRIRLNKVNYIGVELWHVFIGIYDYIDTKTRVKGERDIKGWRGEEFGLILVAVYN